MTDTYLPSLLIFTCNYCWSLFKGLHSLLTLHILSLMRFWAKKVKYTRLDSVTVIWGSNKELNQFHFNNLQMSKSKSNIKSSSGITLNDIIVYKQYHILYCWSSVELWCNKSHLKKRITFWGVMNKCCSSILQLNCLSIFQTQAVSCLEERITTLQQQFEKSISWKD